MLHTSPSEPTDLAYILPTQAYHEIAHHLRNALPPPLDDTPEALTRRDHAAIAQAAALQPGNCFEAQLAARAVATSIQSMDALGLAADPAATEGTVRRCSAQAASMMRQADSATRMLLRLQDARRKLQSRTEAYDQAERAEHITAVLMKQAFDTPAPARRPAPPAEPAPAERSRAKPDVSSYDPESRKHTTETPARRQALPADPSPKEQPKPAPHPLESARKRALIDAYCFGPREPDPNRRYPGESAAMLLVRRQAERGPDPEPKSD